MEVMQKEKLLFGSSVTVTKENLEKEHICCAISNNKDVQVTSKKSWLLERFDEGLVFLKSEERGKCFIEYIPADVLQKREIEEQEREAEEIRIKELKEKCQKKGLNFEVENKKILGKREAKRVKAEKKAAKKNK